MIPTCRKPDPNPRPPRFKAPPGATDTHFHIFGPEYRYPFVLDRLSLPITRFVRTGDAIRPRLHGRRCPRSARSGARVLPENHIRAY